MELLPIGSIVLLNEEQKAMIIGHHIPVKHDDEFNVCDYCGCLYPEGTSKTDDIFGFDEDNIQKVLFVGYRNEENEQEVEIVNSVNSIFKDIMNNTQEPVEEL